MQENYLAQTSCQVIETIKWIHDCVQDQTEPPDTILSSRFDSFFKHVLKSGHEDVKSNIKSLIEQILGERVVALEESMPHLQVLLGHTIIIMHIKSHFKSNYKTQKSEVRRSF
jgi:hypothetical protein